MKEKKNKIKGTPILKLAVVKRSKVYPIPKVKKVVKKVFKKIVKKLLKK